MPCWSLNCTNLSWLNSFAGLKHKCFQFERRDCCVLWGLTHLRQCPNTQQLRSAVCVWVLSSWWGSKYLAEQLRVSCSLTHWGWKWDIPCCPSGTFLLFFQNKQDHLTLNDIKKPEFFAIMIQVPVLCDKPKPFLNGPGALMRSNPACSWNPVASLKRLG